MRIIIAGSRSATAENVKNAIQLCPFAGVISCVLSGMAYGADKHGELWAAKNEIPVEHHPADWDAFGKAAGHIRNEEMAKCAHGLIAVWDGQSRGTNSMVEIAMRYGLRVLVFNIKMRRVRAYRPKGKIADLWELVKERAAIMQYCGMMSKQEAERKAGVSWNKTWI